MLNIAICDNNINDREEISKFIDLYFSNYSYSYRANQFQDAKGLLESIKASDESYTLIFIDISLPDVNGLEAAAKILKYDKNISIIFNTNKKECAADSFRLWPFYFNVKPMTYSLFTEIMDRYLQFYKHIGEENIVVKNGNKLINLSYNEISFIESQNTTIKIHMNNYEILKTYGKLDDLEHQLSNKRFLRCHKSFLINMDYIKSIEAYKFTTIFGDSVSIKQREASKIKKAYYDYVMEKKNYDYK